MILNSEKNTNYASDFDEKLEKSDRINVNSNVDLCSSVDTRLLNNNQNTLPYSVRLSSSFSSIIWDSKKLWSNFRKYLINEGQRKNSVRNKVGYARRYYQILESKDARILLNLSHGYKVHTMKALASLSKYLGRYDEWLDIVNKYKLKWSKPDKSINVFKSIIQSQNQNKDLISMMTWIRNASALLPQAYKNVLLFNTLTGRRPDEAQKAIWLIKKNGDDYVDKDSGILKHYQFPSIFLRQTKKRLY